MHKCNPIVPVKGMNLRFCVYKGKTVSENQDLDFSMPRSRFAGTIFSFSLINTPLLLIHFDQLFFKFSRHRLTNSSILILKYLTTNIFYLKTTCNCMKTLINIFYVLYKLQVEHNSIKSASAGEITSHSVTGDGSKSSETKPVSTSDNDKRLGEFKKGKLGKLFPLN